MVRTFGIDISSYSLNIDWDAVVDELNPRFVITRAFHMGPKPPDCYADMRFVDYWPVLAQRKLPRGAYLFCHPSANAAVSVNNFFSVYTPQVGDIVPTLDIEDIYDNSCGVRVSKRIAQIDAMIKAVSARIGGQKPMIYTKARVWADLGNPAQFSDCPLWIIDYDSTHAQPSLPPPWHTYAFWQFDHDLKIEGIGGDYDPD
jgi:GH25 family lysozyme M1 (1,4-beta-N-acetylmuramidase)